MRRFAVVGSPIEHSLSPLLHRTAYARLDIRAEYARFEVPAGELESFLAAGPGAQLDGLSVTMPLKPEALAFADEADELSVLLGAANTLLRRSDGAWRAENHDVHGIAQALRDVLARSVPDGAADEPDESPTCAPRIGAVLGSGATAGSAVAALAQLGVDQVLLSARSQAKLERVGGLAERCGLEARMIPWSRRAELLSADLLVSALAAPGARAVAEEWAALSPTERPQAALDVLYDPWPAPLAAVLTGWGVSTASGLEMLVHQADMQLRAMVGVESAPVREMLAAARAAMVPRSADAPGDLGR